MSASRFAVFLSLSAVAVPFAVGQTGLDDLMHVRAARSRRIASNSPDHGSNADNRWVKPGDTFTLAEISGSGVIRHIWVTFPEAEPSWISKPGCAAHDELVLRMYWDGAEQPAVETPFGDFFAAGFGKRAEVVSAPVTVQGGDAYNCYWAMPFHKGARITLTNESDRPLAALYYQIDYTEEAVAESAGYFCAQYRQEFPTVLGHDYLICDAESAGGGHYVGTVMSFRSRSPQWFGEGDEKFYIDGDKEPSVWGTGTEDYFSNAWGLEKGCYPYFGVPQLGGEMEAVGAWGSMYRWHIPDAVRFRKSLRLVIEHAGWLSADETESGKVEGFVEREDDFATVAFWYQIGQPKRFAALPPLKERKLPSIDIVIEGKDLLEKATGDGGERHLQAGAPWTGAGQLFFNNEKGIRGWFECKFDVAKEERRRLTLPITFSYDFGQYRITLDGKPIAGLEQPLDLFSPKVEVREISLGDMTLPIGSHTLRFECTGRNAASGGFKMGLDSVRLRERWDKKRPAIQKAIK